MPHRPPHSRGRGAGIEMATFKIGDRVTLARHPGDNDYLTVGMIGTVLETARRPFVDWDGLTGGHSGHKGDDSRSVWAVDDNCLKPANAAANADVVAVLLAAGIVTQAQVDAANALIGGGV